MLLLACVGFLLAGGHGPASTSPAASPRATIDPRLIIHPRTLHVMGAFSGGVRLSGTLSPAYPGENTFHLTARRNGRNLAQVPGQTGPAQGSRLTLEATMPGMAMPPVHGTLTGHDGRYSGTLRLPMFGTYRIAVTIEMPGGPETGTITVTLPLPGL